MAARYHISADGKARKCQAKTPEACRNTIAALRGKHFDSKPEAAQAYEKVMEEKTLKRHQKQKKAQEKFQKEEEYRLHLVAQREIEEKAALLEERFNNETNPIAKNAQDAYESIKQEYGNSHKDNDRLEELEKEKNGLSEEFRNALEKNIKDYGIDEFSNIRKKSNKRYYGRPYYYNDSSAGFESVNKISEAVYILQMNHLREMLHVQKNVKYGLMDKVFSNKEEEGDKLFVNSAVDYVKNVYNPNDSSVMKKAMNYHAEDFKNYNEDTSYFINNFINKDKKFGEEVIVLKASSENFPVKDQKDYVHFSNIDFSRYPDDHKEISEIYGKLSNIQNKMYKYNEMLKTHGEEADPEIVQSAKMSVTIGNKKAKDIIKNVKEMEKSRKETESFYNDSKVHQNKELDETELDLFHEIKSTSF